MRGHRCSKHLSQWEKVAKCNFKSKAQAHEKCFFLMKWTVFLQCRRQIFMSLSFFAEKVILELKCTKITSLELLRTPILCFSATKQIWECWGHRCSKNLSQWEKVAKCNFKSKAQVHEKCFFLMKWTVFCNAEDRFSWVWAFLQKKSFLELKCTKSLLRASKNTNSVFSATKQIMRMRGHRCSKASFSVRKSC